ncbi:uncharacterized protein LOC119361585 [Triticum dicoccoides]|uniref:uncharacterized protein LOC119361585 n=1 Tax=Triticum dicoccoides TaxID=85692 RepID=UPI00188F91D5|nr:uncharacterized protein LOC119361585 [Triticum dicoccoides]
MATVEVQVEQWQERGIQVLVLLSFMLQLVLLVLAEFRRRIDSGVLRAVIWSAYMIADSVAIYTLGHLSLTSRSNSHELMAFWAPFLLVHLGGQDNITAYAIEDNRLWLRHLQELAVQVAAAAYVLYESTVVSTQALLRNAAILMFVVGVLKYGERVWALKRAGTSAAGKNYRSFEKRTRSSSGPPMDRRDTEGLLRIAHLLLDVPKDLLQGPLPNVVVYLDGEDDKIPANDLYKVVEMQLSLMHDVVYSKAEVIHTWYGLCIRAISPVFTAVAFMLFHGSGMSAGSHYSRADVVITYVLLGGALTLEMISVLRTMFSRWSSVTLGKLAYDFIGEERCMCGLLARATASIRRFVLPKRDGSRWWWSGCMGQHNLIDLCVQSRTSRASRIAGWMGVEDWWNTMMYSSSISVSTTIKELLVKQVLNSSQGNREEYYHSKSTEEGPDHIINSRGRAALKKWGLHARGMSRVMDMEFDESILVLHIATEIYLIKYQWLSTDHLRCLAEAIKAMSNYMLFLLVARPYMLPGSANRTRYVDVCYCLTGIKYNTSQDLAALLTPRGGEYWYYRPESIKDSEKERCINQCKTVQTIYILVNMMNNAWNHKNVFVELEMIAEVWVEMLCYAGYRCSGYSHAKQLSNGGELLTVAALVVEYYRRNVLKPRTMAEQVKEEEQRRAAMQEEERQQVTMQEQELHSRLDEPPSPPPESNNEISSV